MLTNRLIMYNIKTQRPAVWGEVWRWWEPRLPNPSIIVENTIFPPTLLTGGFISAVTNKSKLTTLALLKTIQSYNVITTPAIVLLTQLQNRNKMLADKRGCQMDKVVSVRLPEEVVAWLSDASRLNKKTISGMAKDIILSGYSAMKSELMPALLELKEQNTVLKEENEQLKTRQRLNEVTKSAPIRKPKVGRNELCPCGSGKKYKHCCGVNE